MKSRYRPLSSNSFKYRKTTKKMLLVRALNNSKYAKKLSSYNSYTNINNSASIQGLKTSRKYLDKSNLLSSRSNDNLDVLNLIIKSNPNQYNYKKISKKSIEINPLFLRGTEENLKRPNFSKNTEEVFYKYNLLYGSDSKNMITTYSPKMRPMSGSINGFNKKMIQDLIENINVFTEEEIADLTKARCKDIGINLRDNMISKFQEYCNAKCKNRIVDLSECYLGINSILIISNIIYNSNRIARLNLTKNNLGDYGVEILIKAVKNSNSLISLNLASNSITHKGGQIIFSQLKDQQSLIDINISSIEGTNRNRVTADGIKEIEFFLKKNIFIEKLNISGNSIKDEGFILLSKGLDDNHNILYLNISNNDIKSKGIEKGIFFISDCILYSLNISNNPILNVGIKKLSDSLKNFQNLHKLNVSNCGFEFSGFEHLLNSLQFNKKIEYLNASGNNLKTKKFEKLKLCFHTFGIKYLNLSRCSLGNEAGYVLGECLTANESIRNINISNNKICDSGFKSYIELFSDNNTIEVFDCSINFITDVSAKEFIKNMKYNRTLKRINFYDNQLTNEMGKLFIEILESNKTLIYVSLMYNKIQIKNMDEVNRLLKINKERQKAKILPNILRDVKNLHFNPESFKYYTQNIQKKRAQQKVLYKKVKQDDKLFTKIKNADNKKIDIKVQEMKTLESEIVEIQEKIKEIKENLDKMQMDIFIHEGKINEKIDEEKKKIKVFKDQNDMLRAEYNATRKDLENIMRETEEKFKKTENSLIMANLSVKSMKKEFKKKSELLNNLYNPKMIIPIKGESLENKEKKKNNNMLKPNSINIKDYTNNNINTELNITRVTTSTNENNITSPSGIYEYKKKDLLKNNLKKSLVKQK